MPRTGTATRTRARMADYLPSRINSREDRQFGRELARQEARTHSETARIEFMADVQAWDCQILCGQSPPTRWW
jgi:hypothetical protein